MTDYVKKCPECHSLNLIHNRERGEIICRDCGLVVEDKMVDYGQEWQESEPEDAAKKKRTGAPMTFTQYDKGLGTEVGQKEDIYSLNECS